MIKHVVLNSQAKLIAESGIFDEHYYFTQLGDTEVVAVTAVEHFLATGALLGLNPHPLFDSRFYLETYPDVAAAGMNPLIHYILHGASEGRFPNRFFDSAYYIASLTHSESTTNPLMHYIRSAMKEKRATHPQFDARLYVTFYPEALATGCDPLLHYLAQGAEQKRLSHIEFDPQFYLDTYKDVAAAGLDPIQHYRSYGRAEGRLPRSAKHLFQNLEHFEVILDAHLPSGSKKEAIRPESKSNAMLQRDQASNFSAENAVTIKVYWGCPLFEHYLMWQFLEVTQRLPEIVFCIYKEFLYDGVEVPVNVQVLDMVLNESELFPGGAIFVSPVESSPVSELMLRAIESGLLVICSDNCELSKVVSPSESSMLPEGSTAEKIVHAISYAAANRQNAETRAQAARARLTAYKC